MAHRKVVVLDVVLDHVLPIDVELVHPQIVERHHLLHAVVRELGLVRLHALRHARLAAAEANEHHAHESLQLDGLETELRAVEFWKRVGCADAAVAAVEVISPAVILAGEKLLALPRSPATTACARCEQTLWKARSVPASSRTTKPR